MKHMVVLSLLNNIKVYVVTHVKVKYRPIVALSDDVIYNSPVLFLSENRFKNMFDAYANNQINIIHIYHTGTHIYKYFILSCNAFIIKHTSFKFH
jgi:hypothetical protein